MWNAPQGGKWMELQYTFYVWGHKKNCAKFTVGGIFFVQSLHWGVGGYFFTFIFCGQIFQNQKNLEPKIFLHPKLFLTQKFFWPNFFLTQNFFWPKFFFDPKNFLTQNFFWPKIFLDPNFFYQKILGTRRVPSRPIAGARSWGPVGPPIF